MVSLFKEELLGSILLKSQIITEQDIETALNEQKRTGQRIGEALVGLGIVMQEDIDWALSHQLDIPYVRVNTKTVDPAAVSLVPASLARRHKLIPLIRAGDELWVAIADPLDKEAVSEVGRLTGCDVSISMGLNREILEMQEHFYGYPEEAGTLGFSSTCMPPEDVEAINGDTTGGRLIDGLLTYMQVNGLSSLSLKPMKGDVTVAGKQGAVARVIGELSPAHYGGVLSTLREKAEVSGDGGMTGRGVISLDADGGHPFEVHLMQAGPSGYVTIRPVVSSPFPAGISEVETSGQTMQTLRMLATTPGGLVSFSAVDADERAWLMDVCLQECVRLERDVLMLGNGNHLSGCDYPVVQAGPRGGDVAGWLQSACAQDIAVVAVGEVQNASSFAAASACAQNGKLLFVGMSAPDVRTTLRQVWYLKDILPMLPWYMKGAAACRGVRTLCPACKEECAENTPHAAFRAKGCPSCRYTGYSKKRYLVEAAVFGEERVDVSASAEEAVGRLVGNGFRGIAEDAADMLRAGDITVEEYMSAAMRPGGIQWQG